MRDVFIVSAVRSPVGRRDGYLRNWSAPELLGTILNAVVDQIDLDPGLIEDVINGTACQIGEQGITLGRMGVLASKLPDHVPGSSVNRQCGSSLTALQFAHGMIASGNMEVAIASGCELMSKYPIASDVDGTMGDGRLMGNPFGQYYKDRLNNVLYNQAQAAEAIAEKWGITKRECEEFAVSSHSKAHNATTNGYFRME